MIKDPRALDQAAAVFKANPGLTAEVQGHTDSTAPAAYNETLSEARARAVRDYFARQGVAPERIRATGFGETRPAAANETPEGRRPEPPGRAATAHEIALRSTAALATRSLPPADRRKQGKARGLHVD